MKTRWRLDKFRDPDGEVARMMRSGASAEEAAAKYPELFRETSIIEDNCLLNEGIQYLLDVVAGIVGSPTLWSAANARVGVGDSSTAAAPAQTDLQALSNKAYAAMDATYPSRSGQTVTWRGTFGDGEGQFDWNEFTVDNGAVSGKTLNRKVESKGTKGAGESWSLSVSITLS